MFNSLSDRLTATFKNLRGRGVLSEADVDSTIREIRRALLDADVALPVVRQFCDAVKSKALGEEVMRSLNPSQQVVKIVHDELVEILGGQARDLRFAKGGPTVIMLAGLQGSGKTTLAGKLAVWLKERDKNPLLVAADLQRPNAVTQLQVLGEQAHTDVFAPEPGNGVGNPVDVAGQALSYAQEHGHNVVIVDTAGRLGVDQEMMAQAAAIRDAVGPDEILFVIDAMIGQDAVTTAEAFRDGVGFTGVVLSKLDGDARGGAALSVATVTGQPIMFASTGEKLTDFEKFYPDRMAGRILDMGDILTLIEQAQRVMDEEEAARMAAKLAGDGDFTLDDFMAQMQQVKKLGSMKKMMGMIPGMAQYREALENFNERELVRIEAIIQSMTPAERANPKIINGSRRSRIAKGSGTTVPEINQLLQRFEQTKISMRQMARGIGPGMPGFGMGGKKSKGRMSAPAKRGKKSRSGNPAKRAQEEAAAAARALEAPKPVPGAAFGAGVTPGAADADEPVDLSQLRLPGGLGGFRGR